MSSESSSPSQQDKDINSAMIKHIRQSLTLSADVDKNIRTMDLQQLESLSLQMMDHMGPPMGGHTFSLPMVGAVMFSLFCFVMPQLTIWEVIFRLQGWPDYAILAAVFPTGIVYSAFICISGFLAARGLLSGLKFFLGVISFTAIIAVAFFLFALLTWISGSGGENNVLIEATLGIVFMALSIKCLNSRMGTRTIAFYLLNRVLRKQAAIEQQKFAPLKR